jgi:hypothetical protein
MDKDLMDNEGRGSSKEIEKNEMEKGKIEETNLRK